MISAKKVIICVLLLFCFVFTTGCAPNADFLNKREQGMYPTTADFPNTKWICRELDMVLNVFELTEYMVGTYKVNPESYRAVVSFEFDQIQINFYSSTDVSKSGNSNSMVHCEPILCGHIYGTYFFDKETETIVCSISNSMSVNAETIPQELTFEKVGVIFRMRHLNSLRNHIIVILIDMNSSTHLHVVKTIQLPTDISVKEVFRYQDVVLMCGDGSSSYVGNSFSLLYIVF